jgi:hypothetical protein
MGYGFEHELMVNGVEKAFDIKVDDPVVPPATLSACRQRIMCAAPRPVAVGVVIEDRFYDLLQLLCYDGLGDPVRDGRYPKRTN